MKLFFLIFLMAFTFATWMGPWAQAQVFAKKDATSFYKKSYEEARFQFLESVQALQKSDGFKIQQQAYADPIDSQLTSNTALIQTKSAQPATNLIVVMSGLHGIEGYIGSALQSKMIEQDLDPKNSHTDYLFIHALNPYGFKNNRRVNRNNIDLNRNFIIDPKDYVQKNTAYAEINSFLNPTDTVTLNFLSRTGFIFSAVKLILQSSLETLREAILKGQYEFKDGLYYGGHDHQYQQIFIDQIASQTFTKYKKVFALDLHTGYGQRNKLHILADSMKQPSAKQLNAIFTEDRIDYGDKKKFYRTTGDLITYLQSKSTPTTEVIGATFEFGTLDSQKTLGSIESLRRMVLENQNFHHPANAETTESVDLLFQDMFYPQDLNFQTEVMAQAQTEFSKIVGQYK
ncbi:MAG: DUF2817 domain-containing protein [Bdellovibrio sp.]|nr:DUF2817 domain-containing protein [Bdellovibrio sp.]